VVFEVAPTQISAGHWRLGIVVAVAILILGGALLTRETLAPAVRALSVPGPQLTADARSAELDCHAVPRVECLRIVVAAMTSFAADPSLAGGGPYRVQAIGVWTSLLCSTSFDCPPGALTTDSVALGSVTLSLTSGREAWLNVVDQPGSAPDAPQARAWIVRWR